MDLLPEPVFVEILMKSDPDALHAFATASARVWRLVSPPTFAQWIEGNNKPETIAFWDAYLDKWPTELRMDVGRLTEGSVRRHLETYDHMRQFLQEAEKRGFDTVKAIDERGPSSPTPPSQALMVKRLTRPARVTIKLKFPGALSYWRLRLEPRIPFRSAKIPVNPTAAQIAQVMPSIKNFAGGNFTLSASRQTKNPLYNVQERHDTFEPDQDY